MNDNDPSVEPIRTRMGQAAAVAAAMWQDEKLCATIAQLCDVVLEAYEKGGRVLLCGNGGSAADCQHIAAELVGRFRVDRPPLAAEALTVNTSTVTAVGNDFSFDDVFARQVQALGKSGDVVIGISTSGNSENVRRGLDAARSLGMVTVAFTGASGGRLRDGVEYCLHVPSDDTARIQEGHTIIGHILCELIEQALFGEEASSGEPP
jgi:D-sedoheptulose 7-phosphate isomerase